MAAPLHRAIARLLIYRCVEFRLLSQFGTGSILFSYILSPPGSTPVFCKVLALLQLCMEVHYDNPKEGSLVWRWDIFLGWNERLRQVASSGRTWFVKGIAVSSREAAEPAAYSQGLYRCRTETTAN